MSYHSARTHHRAEKHRLRVLLHHLVAPPWRGHALRNIASARIWRISEANSRKVHRPGNDMSGSCQARADCPQEGMYNRSQGTDNRTKGTYNRSKGTHNRSEGTDNRTEGTGTRRKPLSSPPPSADRTRSGLHVASRAVQACPAFALAGLSRSAALTGREGAACAGLRGPGAAADLQSCTRCKFATKSRIDPERQERRCCCCARTRAAAKAERAAQERRTKRPAKPKCYDFRAGRKL